MLSDTDTASPTRATTAVPPAMRASSTPVIESTRGKVGSPSRNMMTHSARSVAVETSPITPGSTGTRRSEGRPSVVDAGSASTVPSVEPRTT